MSSRHMHITGYLLDGTRDGLWRFIEAACSLSFFSEVIPVRRADGEIIAVALYSSADDYGRMPEIARRLSGILGQDIEIASAQDNPSGPGAGAPRQAWFVPGRGEAIRGQVIKGTLELGPGETGREQVPHYLIPPGAG